MKIIKKDRTPWYIITPMSMVLLVLFTFCLAITGCTSPPKTTDDSQGESYTDPDTGEILRYTDGTYCAEVEYYYSKTGTRSTYTLSVEIEDNQLIRIDWPNGGWLDDTHFNPPDIEDGTAEFTSDEGVDYTVTILGEDGYCALSSSAIDEDSLIDQQREDEYQEELDAQEEQNRVREEEEQEERDHKEQERQTEELEQSEEQAFTRELGKDIHYYYGYDKSVNWTHAVWRVPFLI